MGCRTVEPQANLIRIAFDGPRLVVDRKRRVPGRGAYVHARPTCLTQAGRSGIGRSLRRTARPDDVQRIIAELSPTDDNSARLETVEPHLSLRDPQRRILGENVAGLAGAKPVEPPPRIGEG
ncbi:MAG: YlxR family protein [Deltaproteobacteria bacterium]|nr:YlxR family protein [Deltaproteobacteria bacterium]